MDQISLPAQYENLNIEGLKSHLRYIKTLNRSGYCAEIFLCDSKVIIPIVKKIYKTKPDQLKFILRSGSISRDNLAVLKSTFLSQSYDLIDSYKETNKLISRLSLPISIDDPMLPIIGVNILKEIALQLKSSWPHDVTIGYALGDEKTGLPGQLKYQNLITQIGYKIGFAVGRTIKIIRK